MTIYSKQYTYYLLIILVNMYICIHRIVSRGCYYSQNQTLLHKTDCSYYITPIVILYFVIITYRMLYLLSLEMIIILKYIINEKTCFFNMK